MTSKEEMQRLEPYEDEAKKEKKRWTWPTEGRFAKFYQYWMLIFNLYYQLIFVIRIGFEQQPSLIIIYIEFFVSAVYFIDMFRCLTQPFMKDGRLVYNRRQIACNYIKTWFLFDVFSFYPLAYLRYHSRWEEGSKDNFANFLT